MVSAEKYKVYFEESAFKEIGDLDRHVRDQFREPVQRLKAKPSHDAQLLRNVKSKLPLYKKRVGVYRMFFNVDSKNHQVVILAIRKRDSDTYDPIGLQGISNRYSGPHDEQPTT